MSHSKLKYRMSFWIAGSLIVLVFGIVLVFKQLSRSIDTEGSGPNVSRTNAVLVLSPGLLVDYYEHGIEHAPPRDPSGCMQRREQFYCAPANPRLLIRSRITKSMSAVALSH